ncbi:MAG: hypothetical protein ACYDIA_18925 [Candidatus Humimicrobiaceae bacterium]
MEKLKEEHFECIMEENSKEEQEKQWKRSEIVFNKFHEYLINKGLKESTADRRVNFIVFFVMNYFFIYEDYFRNVLLTDGDTIKTFLGNWYIRKLLSPNIAEIKSFLMAISDFFTFLKKEDLITKEDLKEINETCRDNEWFEMRLHTYFEVSDDQFYDWIQDHNYDYI